MRKELEKLTTKQLIELVKTFEHYPAVTLKDGKDYILSYLEDEACAISKKEIAEYLIKSGVEITKDNIHLYYEFMSEEDLEKYSHSFIADLLLKRQQIVIETLGHYFCPKWYLHVNIKSIPYIIKESNIIGYKDIGRTFFNVKDTLKPIEEYISEIKNSDAFISYITKV